MEIGGWISLFLLIGIPITVGLCVKYSLKWKIDVAAQLAVVTLVILTAIYLLCLMIFDDQLSPEKINILTLLGIITTLGALGISLLIGLKDHFTFSILGLDLETESRNTYYVMQNTQQIITQIKQLEESQKALADQIRSLQDRIPVFELSEPSEGDDIAGIPTRN